jgi:hypothetical protein
MPELPRGLAKVPGWDRVTEASQYQERREGGSRNPRWWHAARIQCKARADREAGLSPSTGPCVSGTSDTVRGNGSFCQDCMVSGGFCCTANPEAIGCCQVSEVCCPGGCFPQGYQCCGFFPPFACPPGTTAYFRECCRIQRCGPERYMPLGRAGRDRPIAPRTGTRARFEGSWARSGALQAEFANSPFMRVEGPGVGSRSG